MFERIVDMVPEQWQGIVEVLLAPLSWIPGMQQWLIGFFLDGSTGWMALAKVLFLLFPVFLWIGAIWCTQLSIYTLPFRSNRLDYLTMMLLAWWDAARAVWLYWVGLFRVFGVALGWLFSLGRLFVHLVVEAMRQMILAPFAMTGKMTRNYFQPGVPWVAFLLLLFWCMLEGIIFTYTLFPTVSEVLTDLVGVEPSPAAGTVLFLFLVMLILGSFACLHVLQEAVRKHEYKFIVQMILVEVFVMFFEVMFLYRELVDAITPWIAQQTGEEFRLGVVFTLSVSTFGWVGIRGMTWFLFGQYGTPPLLAFISRRPLYPSEEIAAVAEVAERPLWWRAPLEDFKREIGWLHERSREFIEYLALPALHVFAAVLNFAMILVAARQAFQLPFKSLQEVMEKREVLSSMHIQPRNVGS